MTSDIDDERLIQLALLFGLFGDPTYADPVGCLREVWHLAQEERQKLDAVICEGIDAEMEPYDCAIAIRAHEICK